MKPVDGKLVFGDPNGPNEVFDAGTFARGISWRVTLPLLGVE